jgi:hypothetical protein
LDSVSKTIDMDKKRLQQGWKKTRHQSTRFIAGTAELILNQVDAPVPWTAGGAKNRVTSNEPEAGGASPCFTRPLLEARGQTVEIFEMSNLSSLINQPKHGERWKPHRSCWAGLRWNDSEWRTSGQPEPLALWCHSHWYPMCNHTHYTISLT